jgi:hypothetical protein
MFVICRDNYPVEIVSGSLEFVSARTTYLHFKYCTDSKVAMERVLYRFYEVPVVEESV